MGRESKSKKRRGKKTAFRRSKAWTCMRRKVLYYYGERCMACGKTPEDGVKLEVDHIKPLCRSWSKRLDFDNLQVLCQRCNHLKGGDLYIDYRPKNENKNKLPDYQYRIQGNGGIWLMASS